MCAAVNTTANNVARRSSIDIPDVLYRSEKDYMPTHARQSKKRKRKRQTWGEMKQTLGF